MTTMVLRLLLGVGAALALTWVALVIALLVARPQGLLLAQACRLLPNVLRRLAGDRSLPRGVRVRLWLVLGYLGIPRTFGNRATGRRRIMPDPGPLHPRCRSQVG
jgi:hypothetical protein